MPRNLSCTRCALHRSTDNVCIWGEGAADAAIMLVGEAPGADEEKAGRPFVGAAGRVLNSILEQAGLARSDVYIANSVKCRPPGNRTPAIDEAAACLPYLLEEIETVRPRVIVALGNSSLKALTGKATIGKERGKVHAPRKGLHLGEAKVIATYHPAAAMYGDGSKIIPNIVADLKLAQQLANPIDRTDEVLLFPPSAYDTRSLYGGEDAVDALKRFAACAILACDLEWTHGGTSMVWPWSNRGEIYSVAITGRIGTEILSVGLAWPPPPNVYNALRVVLSRRPIVFHNAMADMLWLESASVTAQGAADTMFLSYLIDDAGSHSLEAAASRYASGLTLGWKGHTRNTKPTTDAEWRELLTYNTDDTRATLLLFEGEKEVIQKLENGPAIARVQRLLMSALPVLLRAALVGVPIDESLLLYEKEQTTKRRDAAIEELAAASETTPSQAAKLAGSTQQTKAFLSGTLGIDLESSTKAQLAEVSQYPAVQAILSYRKETKLLSTYLEPWTTMLARQHDGRLHTVYRLTGTRTGRLSSEAEMGGPLQVVPRAQWVREMIRAKSGRLIVSADYATVEMRVAAWLANEPTMLALFQEGADLHRATAAFIIACRDGAIPIESFWSKRAEFEGAVTKDERQRAKGANFGLVYGMQQEKFRDYARTQYGVVLTPVEARMIHESYFRLYSALPSWHERAMRGAERLGYTETPFGRRRAFEADDVHKAINTPVQSTASDLTLLAMVQADAAFKAENLDATIVGFVHDSIIVDAKDEHAQRVSELLVQHMERVDTTAFGFEVPIPLVADVKVGESWG